VPEHERENAYAGRVLLLVALAALLLAFVA
jgi:hypothetical protein